MNRKPIFDSVRAMLGRGFKQSEVGALDRAIDRALGIETEKPEWVSLASPLIREFEGYARKLPNGDCQAYPDPATGGKPWTIGFGSTTDEHGAPIEPGTVWPRERAEARFEEHLREFGEGVTNLLADSPATAAQTAAFVSLAYNIGLTRFGSSTALRRHREGDYEGAAEALTWFNKANGQTMGGLIRRREAEKELYLS